MPFPPDSSHYVPAWAPLPNEILAAPLTTVTHRMNTIHVHFCELTSVFRPSVPYTWIAEMWPKQFEVKQLESKKS